MMRQLLRQILHKMGYEIRPIHQSGWHPAFLHVDGELTRFEATRWHSDYIRRLGLSPRTVVDIGVGHGTPELYQAFPDAHLVLIEPLIEFEADVDKILASRQGSYHAVALGAHEGVQTINVEPVLALRSSMYARCALEQTGDAVERREVAVTTLDALHRKLCFNPPIGLKIDAEGAELDILKGATEVLNQTQFVIAELPLISRFVGGYALAEAVALLDAAGFILCDVLDLGRAESGETTFMDAVFRRK